MKAAKAKPTPPTLDAVRRVAKATTDQNGGRTPPRSVAGRLDAAYQTSVAGRAAKGSKP
jgi:hypothetical protein